MFALGQIKDMDSGRSALNYVTTPRISSNFRTRKSIQNSTSDDVTRRCLFCDQCEIKCKEGCPARDTIYNVCKGRHNFSTSVDIIWKMYYNDARKWE